MGVKTKLVNVRLSFPSLFQMTNYKDNKPGYEAKFIFEKDSPAYKAAEGALKRAVEEKWPGKGAFDKLMAKGKINFYDGDDKEEWDGFPGNYFIGARQTKPEKKPKVLDQQKNPIDENDGRLYAGCYVDAVVEAYAYDADGTKGASWALLGVQLRRSGPSLGGTSVVTDDDFDTIEDTGEQAEEEDLLGF